MKLVLESILSIEVHNRPCRSPGVTKSIMYSWPNHYPNSCPPNEAEPTSGQIYRFTYKSTPMAKDFKAFYDGDPSKDWGDLACQARGLSVYPTLEACREAAGKVPSLAKKKLASGAMQVSYGKIAETPSKNTSSHMTWWVGADCPDPVTFFVPVDVGGNNA